MASKVEDPMTNEARIVHVLPLKRRHFAAAVLLGLEFSYSIGKYDELVNSLQVIFACPNENYNRAVFLAKVFGAGKSCISAFRDKMQI